MPRVSIIVPVYECEKYISHCIDGIIAQTYTDWELLLIDDGSLDCSGNICDEYATKDSRIRVFHKANGGVSSTRNVGLDYAEGQWVAFVDSDDILYPKALEVFVGQMEKYNLDLIQCHYNRVYKEEHISYMTTEIMTGTQYAESDSYLTCVWGGLFKVSIIQGHHLRFDENIRLGEDQLFLLDYMQYCQSIMRIADVLYFYRNNENSAVNNPKVEYELASVIAFNKMKKTNPIASKRCDAMLLYYFVSLTLISRMPVSGIRKLYEDVSIDYINPGADIVSRYTYYLIKINVSFAVRILRLLYKIRKICQK